jgi:transposase
MATKTGRPTKLTRDLERSYLDALRRTRYLETAADLAGIHRVTLKRWLKRGRREPGPYREFCIAVKKVLAESEANNVGEIESAEEWQASAWLLERRFPERWGRKERHEITGEKGGPVVVKVLGAGASMSDL